MRNWSSSTIAMDGVLHVVTAVAVHIHDVGSEGHIVGIDVAIPVRCHYRSLFLCVGGDVDRLIGGESEIVGAGRCYLSVQQDCITFWCDEVKLRRKETCHQ